MADDRVSLCELMKKRLKLRETREREEGETRDNENTFYAFNIYRIESNFQYKATLEYSFKIRFVGIIIQSQHFDYY